MKIVEMRVTPIAIADPPLRSSYGLHSPYALRTVVELVSEDGVCGIGEGHGGEANVAAFEKLRSRVVGGNPYRLAADLLPKGGGEGDDRSQTWKVPGENPADAAARLASVVEIACLDLIGRATGTAVCDLLGGRHRDAVPFAAYAFYKHAGGGGEGDDVREDEYGEALSPEQLAKQAVQMVKTYGYASYKLKGGVLDPDVEIESMKAVREALGPDMPLRIDPNSAWSVETSIRVGKALKDVLGGGGYLEDPTAGIDGMAAVRKGLLEAGVETPLASNVAITSFAHLKPCVETGAAQVVLCDPHYWGGIGEVQHLSKVCQAFGLGLSMHSNSHLGVSLMAMAHAAAAAPHLDYACDTHYPWQSARDEIVEGGRVPIVNGSVRIPDRPGLGVDLDRDQLARGRERYEKCPYRRRDDVAEMRKHVDPNWERKLPRW